MNADFLELIQTRRSVRAYRPEAVPEDVLERILQAGTFAPTGMGKQSPVMVVVTDPDVRRKIAAMNAAVMGADRDPYYGAPTIVLVLADPEIGTWVEDGSCVLATLMLAAHAQGVASVWVHREREMFDGEEGKALLREWGLPESLRGVGSVALGYAAVPAAPPRPRKAGYIVRS